MLSIKFSTVLVLTILALGLSSMKESCCAEELNKQLSLNTFSLNDVSHAVQKTFNQDLTKKAKAPAYSGSDLDDVIQTLRTNGQGVYVQLRF
jgi:hypothetical protein